MSAMCHVCHMDLEDAGEYHPFVYCELFTAGHDDPEAYLRGVGFVRLSVGQRQAIENLRAEMTRRDGWRFAELAEGVRFLLAEFPADQENSE